MDKKIAFLGCGNMATAMIGGILASGMAVLENIMATARTKETLQKAAGSFGILTTQDNRRHQPLRILYFFQ